MGRRKGRGGGSTEGTPAPASNENYTQTSSQAPIQPARTSYYKLRPAMRPLNRAESAAAAAQASNVPAAIAASVSSAHQSSRSRSTAARPRSR